MTHNTRAVVLRLDEDLIDRIDAVVHDLRLQSRADFLRLALRNQTKAHEDQVSRSVQERAHNGFIAAHLQDTLIVAAPGHWRNEQLEQVEKLQMEKVRLETRSLPDRLVATRPTIDQRAAAAVAELKAEIRRQVADEVSR